jgi:neutral ceramidase
VSGAFYAGTGRVDITPPVGSLLAGYIYPPRISRGVRDRLYATSVVAGDDDRKVALVSCDLIALPGRWCDQAKERIETSTGIPPERTMISATHIHTGPCTAGLFICEADWDYLAGLPDAIASSVAQADRRMEPAHPLAARVVEGSLSFNRRFRMSDGSVRTNPGVGNPEIVGAMGPIDPEILVLVLKDDSGKILGCVFNYSNHVDVLSGSLISADYPGMLARRFRERFGDDSNLVYLNGACGDLNHIDTGGQGSTSGEEQSDRMAGILYNDLSDGLEVCEPLDSFQVNGAIESISIPRHRISQEEVTQATKVLLERQAIDLDVAFARELLLMAQDSHESLGTVVQAIRIGGMAWVGLPGEVFVEIGLGIKAASPFERSAIVELANDYVGYLATDDAYFEGGYEVRPARSSQAAPGAAKALTDASLRLLEKLYR